MDPIEILARLAESGTPPDAPSALKLSVGLDKTIAQMKDETLPFLATGGANLQFVLAPYGRGKTHLLKSLQEVARSQGFATAYVDCGSGWPPFASLQETYRAIAQSIVPPEPPVVASRRSGPEALVEAALAPLSLADARERLHQLDTDVAMSHDYRNLAAAYGRIVLQQKHREPIGDSLRALLRADRAVAVRVGDLYKQEPWLPRPIGKLSRRNAALWLRSVASLPAALGYPGLVVLFDETEKIHSLERLGKYQRQACLANLRNFVDHIAMGDFRNCAVFYAVVEDFVEAARRELEALSQRIERVRLAPGRNLRNPRAVSVSLDELTVPQPSDPRFFASLGRRIVKIGVDARLPEHLSEALARELDERAEEFSQSINDGAVRDFVKYAAARVVKEVSRNG